MPLPEPDRTPRDIRDDTNPTDHDKLPDKEESRRRYGCLIFTLSMICIFCFAFLLGIRWLSTRLLDRLSPDQRTTLLTADTTIVHLPDEWHQPAKPLNKDVIAYLDAFGRDVSRIVNSNSVLLMGADSRGYSGGTAFVEISERDSWSSRALLTRHAYDVPAIDDDQRASYTLLMAELQPVIDATTTFTAMADFSPEKHDDEVINFLAWQQFAKLMRVKAMVELADGQCSAALESATLPFRMTRRPAQVNLISHLIAIAINTITVESMVALAGHCHDPAILHQALQNMADVRENVTVISPEYMPYVEVFAKLRAMDRAGVPVNLKPQSIASLYKQYIWGWSENHYLWLINNLPPGDPRIATARSNLATLRSGRSSSSTGFQARFYHALEVLLKRPLPTSEDRFRYRLVRGFLGFDPAVYSWVAFGLPNYEEAGTRAYVSQARFDLARLLLAQKLAIIEGKMDEATSPTASATAITPYINPMPLDPFTSATFPLSPHGQFYSVGPDKTDNHTATPYDATNGTTSPGDIYFLPPKDPNTP